MGFQRGASAIQTRGELVVVKSSSAETASTTGAAVDTSDFAALFVSVDVTAATGTTRTRTVVVEGSNDGVNWFTLGTVGANGYAPGSVATAPSNITGVVTVRAMFAVPAFVRTRSVIGGTTPSFTYSVTA